MIKPRKLKIGGHIFTIKYVDKFEASLEEDLGSCDRDSSTLVINTNSRISESQRESTLIHEILEAINDIYDVGLEHRQIQLLESTLYQIFVDNNLLKD